jgi:two-component system sensor histidine kinase TctE
VKRFKAESLRRSLVQTFIWLWVASALAATLVAFWLAGRSAQISFDRILKDDALALATQIHWDQSGPVFAADPNTADYLIFDSLSPSRFMVINQDGKKLVGNALLKLPADAEQQKLGQPIFFDYENETGNLRVVAIRLDNKQSPGYVWVLVGESQSKRNQISRDLAAAIFLPALGLTVFIVPLLFAGIRYGLAPANAINDAVSRRGINDLSAIPISEVPAELRGLISHINDLLRRVQEAITHERRFISDAAHQLRTPLAGIKLLVDDLLRTSQASPNEPPNQEVLNELSTASTRVTQLVKQLLTLARSEGASNIETSQIELGPLIVELTVHWRPIFLAANKQLAISDNLNALGALKITTNGSLLKEILTNLLDNAFNYGGNKVALDAKLQNQRIHIQVLDDGENVVLEDIDKMLTPFWRGKDLSTHGVGLGLPIAQKTAILLGGQLSIQIRPQVQGTQVSLDLPLELSRAT